MGRTLDALLLALRDDHSLLGVVADAYKDEYGELPPVRRWLALPAPPPYDPLRSETFYATVPNELLNDSAFFAAVQDRIRDAIIRSFGVPRYLSIDPRSAVLEQEQERIRQRILADGRRLIQRLANEAGLTVEFDPPPV